jgi:hypothetical protein
MQPNISVTEETSLTASEEIRQFSGTTYITTDPVDVIIYPEEVEILIEEEEIEIRE